MDNLPQIIFWVIIITGVVIVLKEAINVIFTRVQLEKEIDAVQSAHKQSQEKLLQYGKQIDNLTAELNSVIETWDEEKRVTIAYVEEIIGLANNLAEANTSMYTKIELLSDLLYVDSQDPGYQEKLSRCIDILKLDARENARFLELIQQREEQFERNHVAALKNIKSDLSRGGPSQ